MTIEQHIQNNGFGFLSQESISDLLRKADEFRISQINTPVREEKVGEPDLGRCPSCEERAWDGRICYLCGAKDIGE